MQINKAADKEAFRLLFDQYFNPLCAFAYNYLSDSIHTEDIVQEAFLSYWERQKNFSEPKAVKAYLYTTVRNQCLNHLKHRIVIRKHEKELIDKLESEPSVNRHIIEEETIGKLLYEINSLPTACREITLLALNGLKNQDIADELAISVNTVKTQKKIAFKKLRYKLSDVFHSVLISLL